eukprot:TRINITY_DN29482_c0_g1_i1.p1 TRINITY_DN29482_c0_g1~~TRINITY_DN29482_c0_g1_i1.p1  ORF type:complete len:511 (+),score=201.99 TRINITY_DN29482_c0_g1_i1:222-1754(+)
MVSLGSGTMLPKPEVQKEESLAERSDTVVMFNACKGEVYGPGKGYRNFSRMVKKSWTVNVNKESITDDKLDGVSLVIFSGSREKFEPHEIDTLQRHLSKGGSLLILTGEGADRGSWAQLRDSHTCNLKHVVDVLSQNTISLNYDSVVRTVHYKYFHPKEAHIGEGVLNREISRAAQKIGGEKQVSATATIAPATAASSGKGGKDAVAAKEGSLPFVYPNGGTVSVQKPAVPLLSSGYLAYPLNRPVCAVYEHEQKGGGRPGRLMVVSSLQMFEDKWYGEEENARLSEVLLWWLLYHPAVKLNSIDAEEPEISDYLHLPDVESLAERVRVCLESPEDLPRDSTTMFDLTMFKFDTDLIPESVKAYELTNVKHEPLTLIQPEFHTPLPPFYPATVPPIHREPPHPGLDLYNLDEHFASEKQRLALLTNKCDDSDLEYYIKESAEIMGLTKKLNLSNDGNDAKVVIEYIFKQIVQFKKLNHEELEKGKKSKPSTPVGGVGSGDVNALGSFTME